MAAKESERELEQQREAMAEAKRRWEVETAAVAKRHAAEVSELGARLKAEEKSLRESMRREEVLQQELDEGRVREANLEREKRVAPLAEFSPVISLPARDALTRM